MAAAVAVGHALENLTRLSDVDDLWNLRRRKQIYSYSYREVLSRLALSFAAVLFAAFRAIFILVHPHLSVILTLTSQTCQTRVHESWSRRGVMCTTQKK